MRYKCQDCDAKFRTEDGVDRHDLQCPKCGGQLWPAQDGSERTRDAPPKRPTQDRRRTSSKKTSTSRPDVVVVSRAMSKSGPRTRDEKYPALRILSHVYAGLAIVCAILGAIGIILVIFQVEAEEVTGTEAFIYVLAIILVTAMGFVAYWSVAEAIRWLIDMEEGSRKTNTLLSKILAALPEK